VNRQIEITHAKRVNERGHTVGVDSYFASYNGERVPACLRIPRQSGRGFRFDVGHRSDLIPATIPK
jgi:hypothetical protein